ncbi:MAG TPA: hypothetical protein VEA99_19225 [Gemmatimonadaceae bacterium]|nr:hypothetical protein [Gemmatimonadaceae bacterium]
MRTEFTIEIASVPDRDHVVAELWYGEEMVAELSREVGSLRLQLYPRASSHWEFDFGRFQAALEDMETRLSGSH